MLIFVHSVLNSPDHPETDDNHEQNDDTAKVSKVGSYIMSLSNPFLLDSSHLGSENSIMFHALADAFNLVDNMEGVSAFGQAMVVSCVDSLLKLESHQNFNLSIPVVETKAYHLVVIDVDCLLVVVESVGWGSFLGRGVDVDLLVVHADGLEL